MKITINSVNYQRNGISGEGFFTLGIHEEECGDLVAVIPGTWDEDKKATWYDPSRVFVLNPARLDEGYRGDNFGALLCPWLEDDNNSNAAWPNLANILPEPPTALPVTITSKGY